MKFGIWFAGAAAIAVLASASGAMAANVALSSDGASFVSGSSAISGIGYNDAIGGADLLTSTPAPAFGNGDTRYIFDSGDNTESLVINLGSIYSLDSFAATFGATDRTPQGLSIAVSNTDSNFSTVTGTLSGASLAGIFTLSSAPVSAPYVEYTFGAPSNGEGVGISRVFASAAPEPGSWALMLVGVGGIGAAMRMSRRKAAASVV